jgi:DNA-binding MarR family transcriptional regulator
VTNQAQAPHPTNGLDDIVHQRARLGVLAIADEAGRVEFGFLRSTLELTAGNLSRHLAVLEYAELIAIEKGHQGRRPRTWIRLTTKGRQAYTAEIRHLRELIDRAERTGHSEKSS